MRPPIRLHQVMMQSNQPIHHSIARLERDRKEGQHFSSYTGMHNIVQQDSSLFVDGWALCNMQSMVMPAHHYLDCT
eukprot:scaffold229882_cov14-Tisochrysis_lutea.AAC.1